MPPNYAVRATVIDARSDTPRPTDRFLVDTNVWAWKHYPGGSTCFVGTPIPWVRACVPYLPRLLAAGSIGYPVGAWAWDLGRVIGTEAPARCGCGGRLTITE